MSTMRAGGSAARAPWTVRVASWSARRRFLVAAFWFAATVGVFAVSLAIGGTRAVDAVSDDDEPARFESRRAYEVFNASGTEDPTQQLLLVINSRDGTVEDQGFRAAIADALDRLGALTATVDGRDVAVFEQLVDPLPAPPAAGLVSPDRTTVRVVGRIAGEGEVLERKVEPIPAVLDELRDAHPGVRFHALNNTLTNNEISELVNSDLDGSLRLTIPLTFLILLVAFGSVVAALVPLVLAVTALLAAFGLLAIYSQAVAPVSPYASQLIVLIGLAVAVDYSLFMITRFRSERRRGRTNAAAIEIASSTAGRAVFFSGLAVMISIAGLFMLDDPLFRSMALGTITVVLVSVVGSLTFLPAVMAILGGGVDRLRVPYFGRQREEGSGVWSSLVRSVMGRPLIAATVTGAVLLAAALPATRLHLGQSDFSAFPDSLDGVQAINLIEEKWPEGSTLQLQVVVTGADRPDVRAAIERLEADVLALERVSEPVEERLSVDRTVALVSWVLAGSQNDLANQDLVGRVREELVPRHFGELDGVEAFVTGPAAFTRDVVGFYADGMPLVFAFVLGLSFSLLLIAFRSVVIPIKAIILNLLSTGAAYGLLILVFQEGWGSELLGVKPGVIESFVPVFIFTILFGLSMDYHVFILTRVKEARDRGLPSNEAVARGIAITSGTITSAAAIMVVVFAVFVTLRLTIIRQLGFGLAVAVLLDATVVRSILLPASMRLLGEWNWWMPRFLSWIPRVTIEAESDEPELRPGIPVRS